MRSLPLLLLALLTLPAPRLAAEDAPPAPPAPSPAPPAAPPAPAAPVPPPVRGPATLPAAEQQEARRRGAALRAALGAPDAPFRFEGQLVFEGFGLGTFTLEAEPVERAEKPAWWVVERLVREAGQGRVVQELACFLAADLTLLQGESLYRAPTGESVTTFGRREGRMEVTEAEGTGATRTAEVDVPADALIGLFAPVRLLLSCPDRVSGDLILPVFEPRHAFPDEAGKPAPAGLADLLLRPGQGMAHGRHAQASAASGRAFTLLLEGGFAGVLGERPRWQIRPAGGPEGSRPARIDWFDRIGQPPQSPWQAFCTFGRGYHLPRRDLLEQAFHWPSVRDHEVAAGTFPPEATPEQVRDYYVAEFEGMSKHRTEADCDDLLVQLLVSSEITHAPGSVKVSSPPVFGGHAYTMKQVGDRWAIVAID